LKRFYFIPFCAGSTLPENLIQEKEIGLGKEDAAHPEKLQSLSRRQLKLM